MRTLRISLAQINTTVGDLDGNTAKILAAIERARELAVDLVVFPELSIPGYPPEDLLLKPEFIEENLSCLDEVIAACQGITAVVGFADIADDIYNAAAVIHNGGLSGVYHKSYLPNYGVFDENRYFQTGRRNLVFEIGGASVGVSICEDIWYPTGPPETQALAGDAEVLVNISASPYHAGKGQSRTRMLATRGDDSVAIVAFCNLVGGQDELVFDGNSVIVDSRGATIARGRAFEEDFIVADLNLENVFRRRLHDPRRRKEKLAWQGDDRIVELVKVSNGGQYPSDRPPLPERDVGKMGRLEEIYGALTLGTRDYVHKNGFAQVVVGLSGGIDSSMTAVIATDALGPENVVGVTMPARYTSEASVEDAQRLAANLDIRLMDVPIDNTFQAYLDMMAGPFADTERDVTEENLQARIRGNVLMALSNKFGWLVLTTGNKSEMSVGYATLYGDMAGGFAVIKDVPKMLVYELAEYRNAQKQVIPQRVIEKPPSAELRPNQRDEDALPPYDVLDPILAAYVEEDHSVEEISALGYDEDLVREVVGMVDRNEYKRRQAPPGVKITPRAFGKDRRLPITNHFHHER